MTAGDEPLALLSAPGAWCCCLAGLWGIQPPGEVSPGMRRPGAIPGSDAGSRTQQMEAAVRALGKEMVLPAVGGGDGESWGGGQPPGHTALLLRHPLSLSCTLPLTHVL